MNCISGLDNPQFDSATTSIDYYIYEISREHFWNKKHFLNLQNNEQVG